jgi:hypothetical protein
MTGTAHCALLSHTLQLVLVWSKSFSEEGHFTLDDKIASRPYIVPHYSRMTETAHHALLSHTLQPVLVWSKSVNNEEHFTLEAETASQRCRASYLSCVT